MPLSAGFPPHPPHRQPAFENGTQIGGKAANNRDFPGNLTASARVLTRSHRKERVMNSIIYIVGLVVIVIAALSFFGLR